MKTIESGARFWDFKANPQFDGVFLQPVIRDADDPYDETKKAGDLMGFLMADKNGETHIIGAAHVIEKRMKEVGVNSAVRITFLGQMDADKGKVNLYKIQVYEGDEWAEFCGQKPKPKKG